MYYLIYGHFSERSPNGAVLGASGAEIIGYKSQPPNNTIMIRGLAQHITENDVSYELIFLLSYYLNLGEFILIIFKFCRFDRTSCCVV